MSSPSERPPNRLAGESSPYLQQHATNPVDWYPWGEEAFEEARREAKPIFLSVGYSACHWCHVMERESFESDEVAAILNEHFVSIKVDREERPDVDSIYMTSVQLLTGSGGWPMSVFLTPDLKPFHGGTYYHPEGMYGRPGFKDLLRHLANAWDKEREKVLQVADDVTQHLGVTIAPEGTEAPGDEAFDLAYRHAQQMFDSTFGGFGGAPKFPHSMDISLLLRHWGRTDESLALDMCVLSLEKMANGGMYDQVGGGFHRYSVDRQWLVPHFEKMLYDNGLLARTYLEGYQATGSEFLRRIACEILDYVLREMTAPEGGFYSATDADSEGEEGKFFVWTPQEVENVLGADDARLFNLFYNVTVGGNFEHSTSIPNVTRPLDEIARTFEADVDELASRLELCRGKLYEARQQRVKPFQDDKIIVSWNGLILSALARAFQVTGEERYRQAAEKAASFIDLACVVDGVLHRIHKDGNTKIPAFLDDYTFAAEALLDLYEATFDRAYLDRARDLTDTFLEEFGDPEGRGLFSSSARHTHLIQRRKEFVDNATPSGNWVAAAVLARLEHLTGDRAYRARAEGLLEGLQSLVDRAPLGFATALIAVDFLRGPVVEIAVVGDPGAAETGAALRAIHGRFLPNKVVVGAADRVDADTAARVPLLADRGRVDGKTTIYICENFACKAPITDLAELEKALDDLAGR